MGEYSPCHLRPSFGPDHGATRFHQDFGEMAPLHPCGSFQQDQTPPRRDFPAPKINYLFFCLAPPGKVVKLIFCP